MKTILLTIEYDGTPYSGWQRQPGRPTVQGEIEKALSLVCGKKVTVDGTSRTDAGVHAFGQRASFSGDFGIPTDRIQFAVNNALPDSICITAVEEKPAGFHARFDSKGKTYIYKIAENCRPDPFMRDHYYFVKERLDIEAMREGAKAVCGTHDFACFQAAGGNIRETTVRTVSALDIREGEVVFPDGTCAREISLEITGNGFLYNMVRIITGTLADIGCGRMSPADMSGIIAGGDRSKAGHTAPPQGLYLKEIFY